MINEAIKALREAEGNENKRYAVIIFDISEADQIEQAIYTDVKPSTLAPQLDSMADYLRELARKGVASC